MSRFQRALILCLVGCLAVAVSPLGFGWVSGRVPAVGAAVEATPDGFLISFQPGTSTAERAAIVAARGARIVQWFASSDTALVTFVAGRSVPGTMRALAAETTVRAIEPNARIYPARVPDDPQYATDATVALAQIGAPVAWETTTGSRDLIVGVIDSGIDYTHPDLAANIWSAPVGWNLNGCGPGTHGYRFDPGGSGCDPRDDYGHGTHVAGTIGAVGNNGVGIAGIDWQTRLMALRVFDAAGYGDTAGALAAIDYAVQAKRRGEPVRILNISWTTPTYVEALYTQLRAARDADILVVAAAGNAGQDVAATPAYPANFGSRAATDPFPEALANVITVAATNAAGDGLLSIPGVTPGERLASNYSATRVDLAAPGEAIFSTFPGDDYDRLSGTSMAAPFVAGAAALLLAALPRSATGPATLTAPEIRARLSECGRPITALADKTRGGKRLDLARSIGGADGCAIVPGYALDLAPGGDGIAAVAASPAPGPYPYGASVTLNATPADGYLFTHWQVDGEPVGTGPSLALAMNGPRAARAFALPRDATPQITTLTPAVTPVSQTPQTLLIEGHGFLPGATVHWQPGANADPGDPLLDTVYLSSDRLRVTIPEALLGMTATVQLRVENPAVAAAPSPSPTPSPTLVASAPPAATAQFVVRQGQTIALGPATTLPDGYTNYGAGPFTVELAAPSGLPVSATTNAICTLNPIDGTPGRYRLTIVRAGRCALAVIQTGDITYAPAVPLTRAFTVYKGQQTVTFNALADRTLGDPAITVAGQASSGLPVRFEAAGDGACALNGQTLSVIGVGICRVTASQHGDGNFNAAPDVVRQFQVRAPTPVPTATATAPPPPPPTAAPPRHTLTLTASGNGMIAADRPAGALEAGTVVTLTANPGPGQLFVGWWIDGTLRSYANPVRLTLDRDHAVVAAFVARPAFVDVAAGTAEGAAIEALAARGVIRGCDQAAGLYCPADSTLRAQMAALIARAMGWDRLDLGNPFPDRGSVDADLWRNVGVLASFGVARGYRDPKGGAYFDPTGEVLAGQTISFITRAMVKQGYWQMQPDNPYLYPNVPSSSGHREDLTTYAYYVSVGVPDSPNTRGNFAGWDRPSSRAWFARALWAALQSHYSVTNLP